MKGGKNSPLRIIEKEEDGVVMGVYAMMVNEILFDMEEGRVGFVDSGCQFDYLL